MVDVSELLLVQNVTQEIYETLKPHITALPGTTNLNVNTMSETIFLSLDDNLDASAFIEEREREEFSDVNDLVSRLKVALDPTGLSVSTNYFLAHGQITLGEQEVLLNSLVRRDAQGKTTILHRTLGQS